MDWLPVAGAVLGGLSSKDKSATTTADRAPWAPAQSWITQNIANGQNLQNAYAAQPFSQGQINAYGNSQALTDNFRSTANSLIPQIGAQKQFDRTNPLARVTSYNYGAGTTGTVGGANSLGFTSQFGMNPAQQQAAAQTFNNQPQNLMQWDARNGDARDHSNGAPAAGGLGFSIGFDPSAAARGLLGGPFAALLNGITFTRDTPVAAPAATASQMGDYGRSATEVGAPNASQAAAIAADFARAMAEAGYGGNDSGGYGSAGASFGGDGGFGAGDYGDGTDR